METIKTHQIVKVILLVLAILFTALGCEREFSAFKSTEGSGVSPGRDLEKYIQKCGYSTDTLEQMIEATKDLNFFTRRVAVNLLAQKAGKRAIPTLKKCLDDPEVRVRWVVAHCLGNMGDKSGLEQMQKDFEMLTPNNGASFVPDPNITDPEEIDSLRWRRKGRLMDALPVARVLAELGDRRGYHLAAKIALEEHCFGIGYLPISVLAEIAKTDKAKLRSEGLEPVFVLKAIAESETDEGVFSTILNYAAIKLPEDIGIEILEAIVNSPIQSERRRFYATRRLDKIRKGQRDDLKKR